VRGAAAPRAVGGERARAFVAARARAAAAEAARKEAATAAAAAAAKAAAAEREAAAARAADLERARAAASAVPADVVSLLARLSLTKYGPELVSAGVSSAAAAAFVTEDELAQVGMKPAERRLFLAAVQAAHAPAPAPAPVVVAAGPPLLRPSGAKVALCVGAAAYPKPFDLANAVADATAVAAKLTALGFAAQTLLDPADVDALDAAVGRFCRALEPGGVGFFFFAGHGVASPDGTNYLLPVSCGDATARDPVALRRSALSLADVLDRMKKAGCLLNVVIADACRIQPAAPRALGRGMVVKGAFERVAAMPAGSVIAFACEQDKEALDGASVDAKNGVFTAALLAHLDAPVHVDTMLIRVTKAVEDATGGVQTPWHNHSLREENVCLH
jgi:hypothetical protein